MGRELRRKQAKKNGKSLEKEEIIEKDQLKRYLKILFVVVGVMSIIYLVSGLFITKEIKWFSKDKTDDVSTTSNSDNVILAKQIFNQSEEEYYVYFYDFDEDEKNSLITSLVNSKLSSSKVYKVNATSALNTNYISDASNKNAKTLDELKVIAPTLIKISGDTITEYYEQDEIKNKLS